MRSVSGDSEFREALRKAEKNETYAAWVRQRADTIRSGVSVHEVLRYFGHSLKYSGDDHAEQISCPFHGADESPSARVHPSDALSASHIWCFVCNERWDVFSLWKKFQGNEDEKFTAVMLGIEKAFGIITPEAPAADYKTKRQMGPTEEEHEVLDLLAVCERRLREAKPKFEMKGFLIVSRLLDQLWLAVSQRTMDVDQSRTRTLAILDKIGEKIRNA